MTVRSVAVRLQAQIGSYIAGMQQAGRATSRFATQAAAAVQKHEQSFNTAGQAAAAFGAVASAGFLASVKSAANFEQAMSNVQAATHETASNMDRLKQAALDAGQSTVFSATEAAGAIEELSKAGVSTSSILKGGLAGALNLAAAGGLAVGEAAETAASAMTQFGLAGDKVPHIADLLAAGAGKAQGSVHDMGMALNQAGLVASQTGLSIEEATGALAAFASAGLTGSDAGTSLKTMLLALTPSSEEAGKLMGTLGISAYDAQGKFIGLANFAGVLKNALSGMSAEQQNATLKTIFGSDAIRAANVLYQQGADGVNKWIGAVNDQGYAAETAAIRLDNLKGDLEQLRGALETAFIGTGEGGLGPLRGLTQGVTGLVNAYNDLPAPAKEAAFQLTGMAGAAGLAGGAALLLVPRIADTVSAMNALRNASPRAAVAMRALALAGAGLAVLVIGAAGIRAIQAAIDDTQPGIEELTASLLNLSATADTAALGKQFEDLGESIRRIADKSGGEKLTDALQTPFEFLFGESSSLRQAKADIESLDSALANLVATAGAGRAQDQFNNLARAWGLSADQVAQLRSVLPQFKDALAGVSNQATLAATGQSQLQGAVGDTAGAMQDEATAGEQLARVLDQLNGGAIDTARAQIQFREQLSGVEKQFKKNGDSLSVNTKKGRENLSTVLDLIDSASQYGQAVADQSGSIEQGRKAYAGQIASLRATLRAAGLTKAQINELIATYGRVPSKAETKVAAPGSKASEAQVGSLNRAISRLPASKQTQFTARDLASEEVDDLRRRIALLPTQKTITIAMRLTGNTSPSEVAAAVGKAGHAEGGFISGPGGPTEDAIPALLSDGEYVVNAAATRKHRALLEAINAGKYAAGGLVQRLAKGGRVKRPLTLDQISAQIGQQAKIATDARATAEAVAKAAAEVERLQALWQETADRIDEAKRRTELLTDITKAQAAVKKAARTKDKGDNGQAAADLRDARKALREYDAEQRRARQQRRNAARAERAAEVAAARASRVENEREWRFEHMTAVEQLADIDARLAREHRFSDEWTDLARQRESIQRDSLGWVNDLLDQQAAITGQLADAQRTYDAAVLNANKALDAQVAAIRAARVEALSSFDLTTRASAGSAVSIGQLVRNAKSYVDQFTGWMEQLDLARQRGVSQDVISSLGLDAGPESLNQLKKLNAGTAEQVAQLNQLVAARKGLAREEAGREIDGGIGQVGADVAAAKAERDAAVAEANDQLLASQADLGTQLGALGNVAGRDYVTAVAQGLASGIPGVVAAAQQLQASMGALAAVPEPPALTVTAKKPPKKPARKPPRRRADGGLVSGPGGPRDDLIPAMLSDGEFVVNAAATKRNRPLLEAINNVGRFAQGGYVAAGRIPGAVATADSALRGDIARLELQLRAANERLDGIRANTGAKPVPVTVTKPVGV